jgi:hypothetical protein
VATGERDRAAEAGDDEDKDDPSAPLIEEEKEDEAPEQDEKPKTRSRFGGRSGSAAAPADGAEEGMEEGLGDSKAAAEKKKGNSVNISAPLSVLEPHRTDPMLNLRQRHKKLERATAASLPEMHFAGQLVSGQGIIQDSTEGCCCRWVRDKRFLIFVLI